MDQMAETLESFRDDAALPAPIRRQAADMLDRWTAGITPAPSELRRLEQARGRVDSCARMQHDGACGWLRSSGRDHGLRVPPVGERAYCMFVGSFQSCPGFQKVRVT
jgi:hypothetical protein